jgi:hypothetical protein
VRALAEREGLDLDKCTAYSDSINDMPLLSMVGNAVAINPDSALRAEAKQHGWTVRDFRTGRKAAMIGVPTALGAGALGGALAAGYALRKAHRERADARAAAEAAARFHPRRARVLLRI